MSPFFYVLITTVSRLKPHYWFVNSISNLTLAYL